MSLVISGSRAVTRKYASIVFVAVLLSFLAVLNPNSTYAQSKSVVVQRRDGDITIRQEDGAMEFRETWVVQFIGGPFRFAFRCIPQDKVQRIGADWSVSENGREYSGISSEAP